MSWFCPLSAPRFSQRVNGFFLRPTPPPSLILLTDKQMNGAKNLLGNAKNADRYGSKVEEKQEIYDFLAAP